MPEEQPQRSVVHERVAFGGDFSKVERRSGVGSHRTNMVTKQAQEMAGVSKVQKPRSAVRPSMPEEQSRRSVVHVVHERVAFGEDFSKVERRSGVGSHRTNMVTKQAQEMAGVSKVQKPRSAVRPLKNLNPGPGEMED